MGGPEVVHPFEQFVPVREGVFDAGFSVGAYHTDITLLGLADLLAANYKGQGDSFALREQCGLIQALAEVYRPLGVEYLGTMTGGYGARLLTVDRLDSIDLSGVTLRAVDVYKPHLLTHGATTVNLPFEDIYPALQSGVIDGICWGAPGAVTGGWHEVVRYQYPDSLGGGGGPSLYFNADTWARLSPEQQQAIRKARRPPSTTRKPTVNWSGPSAMHCWLRASKRSCGAPKTPPAGRRSSRRALSNSSSCRTPRTDPPSRRLSGASTPRSDARCAALLPAPLRAIMPPPRPPGAAAHACAAGASPCQR